MRVFQRRTFLTSAWAVLHPTGSRLRERTIVRTIFKLKNRGRAILSGENYRNVIFIPPSAMVTLLGGDIVEDAFVKIRYEGKVLLMLSEELRSAGELWGKSA
jgi:hypothetical protein